MDIGLHVHDVRAIKVSGSHRLNTGHWVKTLTLRTPEGTLTINIYSNTEEELAINNENGK